MTMTYNETDYDIEYGPFEDMRANNCLLHALETDFTMISFTLPRKPSTLDMNFVQKMIEVYVVIHPIMFINIMLVTLSWLRHLIIMCLHNIQRL